MQEMYKHRPWVAMQDEKQLAATRRMALFPDKAEVLFIAKDVWVVRFQIVSHVTSIFLFPRIYSPSSVWKASCAYSPASLHSSKNSSTGSLPSSRSPLQKSGPFACRYSLRAYCVLFYVSSLIPTSSRPESIIAPYLTTLQARLRDEGIRVGSYPVLQEGVYVSLIGSDQKRVREIGAEVEKEIMGNMVTEEEVVKKKEGADALKREEGYSEGGKL
jgi:hypothetical protein